MRSAPPGRGHPGARTPPQHVFGTNFCYLTLTGLMLPRLPYCLVREWQARDEVKGVLIRTAGVVAISVSKAG